MNSTKNDLRNPRGLWLFLWMALAGPAAGQVAGETNGARNAALLNLAPNTWVHVKPDRNPVGRSYSGICYGGGQIFYFGGGHGSYPCNDVELYDVAANKWTQATEPESFLDRKQWTHLVPEQAEEVYKVIGGGSTHCALSPKSRPLVHHTYQMHAWWPEQKKFYNLVRNLLWSFDPDKREWKMVCDKSPTGRDIHTWCLRYDPILKTLVAIVGVAEQRGAHVYDALANSWKKKADTPAADWTEIYAAYDTDRKRFLISSNKKWWTLDTGAWQTKVVASLPNAGESFSMDYDPGTRQTLVLKKDGLWAYDSEKDAWAPVKMNGTPPSGITQWGLLDYDPVHRCHLLLGLLDVGGGFQGGRVNGLYAFRLEPGNGAKK